MLTDEESVKAKAEGDRLWKQAGRDVTKETFVRMLPRLLWYAVLVATIVKVWWPR